MKRLAPAHPLLCAGTLGAEPVDVLLAAAKDTELQPLIAQLGSPHVETRAPGSSGPARWAARKSS